MMTLFPSWKLNKLALILTDDGLEEYLMQEIVDSQCSGAGWQYLVCWIGYRPHHNYWLSGSALGWWSVAGGDGLVSWYFFQPTVGFDAPIELSQECWCQSFFPLVIFQRYFIFIPWEGVRWYLPPTIFVLVLLTTSAACRPHCSLDLKLCHRSGILCSGLWCEVHYPQWLVCQVTHQWFQWVSDSSKTTVWQWHG